MASYELTREEMIEPIERMFDREHGGDIGMFSTLEDEETEGGEGNVDLVYVHGDSEQLHVIRIEEDYDNCLFDISGGIHSLAEVEANFRWIALPLYELREGEDAWNDRMKEECDRRGIGIITAQKKGRGVSAKTIKEPTEQEGSFLAKYGRLVEEWEAHQESEGSPEGYRVVDYYKS